MQRRAFEENVLISLAFARGIASHRAEFCYNRRQLVDFPIARVRRAKLFAVKVAKLSGRNGVILQLGRLGSPAGDGLRDQLSGPGQSQSPGLPMAYKDARIEKKALTICCQRLNLE